VGKSEQAVKLLEQQLSPMAAAAAAVKQSLWVALQVEWGVVEGLEERLEVVLQVEWGVVEAVGERQPHPMPSISDAPVHDGGCF
jgi:hypothetical protein